MVGFQTVEMVRSRRGIVVRETPDSMNSLEAKRLFLKLFVGFLCLTAAVAILSVLSGDFGEFQMKVLASSFSISAASICAMSCAGFMAKRKQKQLGLMGMVFSVAAAVFLNAGLWLEIDGAEYWKATITLIVIAAALAHAFLLALPDLNPRYRRVQIAAGISIGFLASQIIVLIWAEVRDGSYLRFLVVVSIVVVLLTLVIPILMKIGGRGPQRRGRLLLSEKVDGTYVDESGQSYRVTKISE